MKALLLLFVLFVFMRGWESIFSAEKKQEKSSCKRCGEKIDSGEEFCYYCEIGEYRIWKHDQKKKKA